MGKSDNRVAVITGGSRGIGRGIALAFAKEGADIAFSYHSNVKAAEKTKSEIEKFGVKVLAVQANSGEEKELITFVDKVKNEFGKINILVNNAGTVGVEANNVDMETSEWDKVINISSELSKKGRAGYGHYAAAKGAINSFTMCLVLELAPGILVNIVVTGPVETDMILADMEPEWVEKEKEIPLGRLGKVEEIAATALFLVSDDGNFFCGQL